eukprot:895622_1
MVQSADGNATKGFLASWNPESAEDVNALFRSYIPEMKLSKFGVFPMKESSWLDLDNKTESGQPAFIAHSIQMVNGKEIPVTHREDCNYNETVPVKTDYVFGTGPKGYGYYHLLTRHAYGILLQRISYLKAPRADVKSWLTGHASQMT